MPETISISNPIFKINGATSWDILARAVHEVIATFPKESRLISEDPESKKITVLQLPLTPQARAIPRDMLVYIKEVEHGVFVAEITNELGKIESYTEQERDKAALNTFVLVVQKAIAGTLKQAVNKVTTKAQPQASGAGVIQIILLIVALITVFIALKALL